MSADEMTAARAVAELKGTTCHGCGRVKPTRMSHCRKCYKRLPRAKQNALYRLVGQGYEQAYADSLKWLAENPS